MDRTALVTGASSGIGAATARRLAKAGFTVYGAARRTDRLAELADAGVRALGMDLADDVSMASGVARILDETGRMDVLVNNAGYGSYGAIEDVPLAEARQQVEVNLFGLARLTQLVLPAMRTQRSGRVVNITSIGGKITTAFGGWYHASKFAVEGLSDALRQEVRPFGIDVVVVEPGAIRTEWSGIAMGSGLAASGDGPYGERARRMVGGFSGAEGRASDPDVVARAIERAVTVRRPRTRYAIGSGAKPILAARRMLSDRVFDGLVARAMG
jgi:NAD(P)-dependent dehydrogenase (short-subunit alcohol dehydrogenase family)